jgi:hypothetical protein
MMSFINVIFIKKANSLIWKVENLYDTQHFV